MKRIQRTRQDKTDFVFDWLEQQKLRIPWELAEELASREDKEEDFKD